MEWSLGPRLGWSGAWDRGWGGVEPGTGARAEWSLGPRLGWSGAWDRGWGGGGLVSEAVALHSGVCVGAGMLSASRNKPWVRTTPTLGLETTPPLQSSTHTCTHIHTEGRTHSEEALTGPYPGFTHSSESHVYQQKDDKWHALL